VHVLLAEGREEFNLDQANDTYKEVQKTIWRGEKLELYADVERLLPEHVKPQCLEKNMEIQEYVRDEGRKKKGKSNSESASPVKGVKRKRNDDMGRNIPIEASTGFVSVATLITRGAKKPKKAPIPKDFELAGQDDDMDMEIESGLISKTTRRTKSSAAPSKTTTETKPRKSATMGTKVSKKKKKEAPVEPTSSQFSNQGIDDEDDLDIEQGIILPLAKTRALCRSSAWAVGDLSTPQRDIIADTGKFPSPLILDSMLTSLQIVTARPRRRCCKNTIRAWLGLSTRTKILIL
jgi:ATP-dependent DNA helicase MPH1